MSGGGTEMLTNIVKAPIDLTKNIVTGTVDVSKDVASKSVDIAKDTAEIVVDGGTQGVNATTSPLEGFMDSVSSCFGLLS
mmetsp:Transcript_15880/g.39446  ORF Transcript_15880/g.39446 Transcript_15880/m.39446 type:complete len:80 (+) Transcript_15880:235-474(+)